MGESGGFPVPYDERSVTVAILSKPLTVYPSAGGMALVVTALLFASKASLLLGLAGIAVGVANFIVNSFFRREVWQKRFREEAREAERLKLLQRPRHIEEEMARLGFSRGVDQIRRLEEARSGIRRMLDIQLEQGEITYQRYFQMAEEVYQASLDKLESMVRKLESVRYIHRLETEKRLRFLQDVDPNGFEPVVLKDRLSSLEGVNDDVERDFAGNEQAVNVLIRTTSDLARIETRPGQAQFELDAAVETLAEMSRSLRLYDRNNSEARGES